MGCGGSSAKEDKRPKDHIDSNKSTILVFGMPDSGQSSFIKALEKCFGNVGGFNQNPYAFFEADTNRDSRNTWIEEYTNQPQVICAFFFVDVSSSASVLLSAKAYNWMKSQLGDQAPPILVANVKNQLEKTNFPLIAENLPDVEVYEFVDTNTQQIQKMLEIITTQAQAHAPSTVENSQA